MPRPSHVAAPVLALCMALLVVPPIAADWDDYREEADAFSARMGVMLAEAAAATSREQRAATYGEMLARSIDHAAYAISTPWDACFAAFAVSYWQWSQLWALGVAALYQQTVATAGDPVAQGSLAVLSTVYSSRAAATARARQEVECP
jgi:hypothetical protein